ncbi:hypothetical protein OH690_05280 [Escherichia coli]|nr:hypothetical protein [Escherichia coli]
MPFPTIPGLLVANEQEDDSDENSGDYAERWFQATALPVDITSAGLQLGELP